jgi:hypothetical protein
LDSTALHRRAAAFDSAALPRAGSALPKELALRPLVVRTVAALESALLQAAWAAPQVIVWRPAAVREMVRPSAGLTVRAGPVVSAALESAPPLEEPAAWGEAEAPQQAVAWAGAVGLPPEAVRQQEARDGAAVPRRGEALRAVPDVRVAEPRAARPSAVLWVFRRDQALPWPAPQPAVRFARTMQCLQIARPSALSWQAVRDEVLS